MFRKKQDNMEKKASEELEKKYREERLRLEKLWSSFAIQEKDLKEAKEKIKTLEDQLEYRKKVSDRVAFEWETREKELLALMDEIDVQKESEKDLDPDLKACLVSLLKEKRKTATLSLIAKELDTKLKERKKALKETERREQISSETQIKGRDGEGKAGEPAERNDQEKIESSREPADRTTTREVTSEHVDSLEQDLKKAQEKIAQLEGAQERDRLTQEYLNDKLKKREIELENLLKEKTGSEDYNIKDGMTFESCLIALKDVKEENKKLHGKNIRLMDDIVKYYEKNKELTRKYKTKEEELVKKYEERVIGQKKNFEKRIEDLLMEVEYLKEKLDGKEV